MKPTKKAMAWLLALVLTLVMPVAFAAELADGVYEATAPGMNGDITVHAAVMGGEIVKITADHSESAEVGAPVIDELIRRVIDVQDPDVDIVTGATQTSEAFVDAMKAALTQAGWEEEDFESYIIQRWTPSPEPTPEPTPEPIPAPTQEPAKDPVLRSDVLEGGWYKDDYVSYVLGNESVQRKTIRAIRFSDSLEDTGKDAWDVSEAGDNSVLAWVNGDTLTIAGRGGVTAPEDASYLFARYDNLESIDFNGCFNTKNTSDMGTMFAGCSSLTQVDVIGFDTGNVTDMNSMFSGCNSLASLDVSGFDTGNVTDMSFMFNACYSLTSLDVSHFDTRNVTNMAAMFNVCNNLTSLDVSHFDTRNVTYMAGMFNACNNLTSLDVSGFDTSNVTNMECMFAGCSSLTSLDVSGFDTSNVKNMGFMFAGCSSLTSVDVSGFDTSNVTDMGGMFDGCDNLKSQDTGGSAVG